MPRPLFDTEFIFGIHEPGGESHMLELQRPGWIVFTEGIGSDPNDKSGKDYRQWSDKGIGVIVRLNNGYHPGGTIPNQGNYANFAKRCANFVANSAGARIWIIGNEMNFAIERPPRQSASTESSGSGTQPVSPLPPGAEAAPPPAKSGNGGWMSWFKRMTPMRQQQPTPPRVPTPQGDPYYHGNQDRFNVIHDPNSANIRVLPDGIDGESVTPELLSDGDGEVITPEMYASCYKQCRDAIHAAEGHGIDRVLIGAVAPWNNQTRYAGNENGDWVKYFRDILLLLGPNGVDGITMHTYTHGQDPGLVTSDATMNPPFENRHFHFRAYQDFANAVPLNMRHLPIYITETDQDEVWRDENTGWVQRAYGEINHWNRQQGAQQIHSLVLYRWPNIDKWVIEGKQGVIQDFRAAMREEYKWSRMVTPALSLKVNDIVRTREAINIRETPAGKVVGQVNARVEAKVVNGAPTLAEGVYWWQVESPLAQGGKGKGWVAQESTWGMRLLDRVGESNEPPPTEPVEPTPPVGAIVVGGSARTLDLVRMRKTPGFADKPEGDIIADIPQGTPVKVLAGPVRVDNVTWWQVKGRNAQGTELTGYMAEVAPNGVKLLEAIAEDPDKEEPPVTPPVEPPVTPPPVTPPPTTPTPTFANGDKVVTLNYVRFRRSAGTSNKPDDDVIAELDPGVVGTIRGGPRSQDDLDWYQVEVQVEGKTTVGWIAEVAANGIRLLGKNEEGGGNGGTTPLPIIKATDLVVTKAAVNVRKTPGMTGKPGDDLMGYFEFRSTLNIIEGPREVDGQKWWRVGGITLATGEVIGWVCEKLPDGTVLIGAPDKLPGTSLPDPASKLYLATPFVGSFGISQLWGERPWVYRQFTYDGVPLKGHNGIDFLTPVGTPLVAVDKAVVVDAVLNDPGGFGNYVKLKHTWGESVYAHMEALAVTQGQELAKGAPIGVSGNTGFSGGPHLHFAIRMNPYVRADGWGGFIDPLPYMDPAAVILPNYVQLRDENDEFDATDVVRPHDYAPGMGPEVPGVRRP